jgi:hypothetical protein
MIQRRRSSGRVERWKLKVAFEPFVNDSVRRFIDDGINDATRRHGMEYFANSFSRLSAARFLRIARGILGRAARVATLCL